MNTTNEITLKKGDKNEEAEELIKRTEVENSPFEIIQVEDRVFGIMGKYRVTEPYEDTEENLLKVKDELHEITWNRLIQVVAIMLENRNKIDELNKEEL